MIQNPIKKPAIALIVAGSISALVSLYFVILTLNIPRESASAAIHAGVILMTLLTLVLSGFVIYGGIAMMKHTSYAWSMAGAICAIVVGLFYGIPGVFVIAFGIWSIIALRKPSNKLLFPTAAHETAKK